MASAFRSALAPFAALRRRVLGRGGSDLRLLPTPLLLRMLLQALLGGLLLAHRLLTLLPLLLPLLHGLLLA